MKNRFGSQMRTNLDYGDQQYAMLFVRNNL